MSDEDAEDAKDRVPESFWCEMSSEDAEDAKDRVMAKIAQVIETLTPEDVQSFLAILHADIEDLMSEHEDYHPELYK